MQQMLRWSFWRKGRSGWWILEGMGSSPRQRSCSEARVKETIQIARGGGGGEHNVFCPHL